METSSVLEPDLEKPEDTLAQDNKEIQVLCSKLFNANFLIAK